MLSTIPELVARLGKTQSDETRPFVLTMSGPSGAGKSTFAETLLNHFDASLVPTDAYYLPDHLIPEVAIEHGTIHYDHPATIQLGHLAYHVALLRDGFPIELPDTRDVILPRPLVIVEGLVANHPPLRLLADLTVCLTAPSEIRLTRRQVRDLTYGRDAETTRWLFEHFVEPDYQRFHAAHDQQTDITIVNKNEPRD